MENSSSERSMLVTRESLVTCRFGSERSCESLRFGRSFSLFEGSKGPDVRKNVSMSRSPLALGPRALGIVSADRGAMFLRPPFTGCDCEPLLLPGGVRGAASRILEVAAVVVSMFRSGFCRSPRREVSVEVDCIAAVS
jgi:hypothetical protein